MVLVCRDFVVSDPTYGDIVVLVTTRSGAKFQFSGLEDFKARVIVLQSCIYAQIEI